MRDDGGRLSFGEDVGASLGGRASDTGRGSSSAAASGHWTVVAVVESDCRSGRDRHRGAAVQLCCGQSATNTRDAGGQAGGTAGCSKGRTDSMESWRGRPIRQKGNSGLRHGGERHLIVADEW